MKPNLSKSESKFFELVRIKLTNAETHNEIKDALASYGMDSTKIAEGKQVLNTSKDLWEQNKGVDAEIKIASNTYKKSYAELSTEFKRHREHTIIFFKKQPEILVRLGVKGFYPKKYNELFDKIKEFYGGIKNNPDIQNEMNKIKITSNVVDDCLNKLDHLLADRANYDKEFGEAQNATQTKNLAILHLKEWVDDFDAIAKIALYDKPQLLETLGIFVRN